MTTEAPEGWTFAFDCSDEHCASYVEGTLSCEQPAELRAALSTFGDGGSREDLAEHIRSELEVLEEGSAREAYEECAEVLWRHSGDCSCSQWAWDSDREYLDVLLDEIEHTSWFISHGNNEWELLYDALSYNTLSQFLGRGGWYRLRVCWNPEEGLWVETESHETRLVAASDERLSLSEAASEIGHWDHVSLAHSMPGEHLELARTLTDEWVGVGVYLKPAEAAAALSLPAELPALTRSELEVATSLVEGWTGSLEELISSARALVQV